MFERTVPSVMGDKSRLRSSNIWDTLIKILLDISSCFKHFEKKYHLQKLRKYFILRFNNVNIWRTELSIHTNMADRNKLIFGKNTAKWNNEGSSFMPKLALEMVY